MTISVMELPAITKEDLDQQSNMLQRMRDLAKQAHDAKDAEQSLKWDNVPTIGGRIGSVTGSNPWNITTATGINTIQSLQGPVTYTNANAAVGGSFGTLSATGSATGGVYTTNYPTISQDMHVSQGGQLELRGANADLKITGKSITAWMERIEERLNIMTPNPELEKEWEDLRRLGERYRKLEKKCKEKAQMWTALKKLPKLKL